MQGSNLRFWYEAKWLSHMHNVLEHIAHIKFKMSENANKWKVLIFDSFCHMHAADVLPGIKPVSIGSLADAMKNAGASEIHPVMSLLWRHESHRDRGAKYSTSFLQAAIAKRTRSQSFVFWKVCAASAAVMSKSPCCTEGSSYLQKPFIASTLNFSFTSFFLHQLWKHQQQCTF